PEKFQPQEAHDTPQPQPRTHIPTLPPKQELKRETQNPTLKINQKKPRSIYEHAPELMKNQGNDTTTLHSLFRSNHPRPEHPP
ncbi:hypothetical protein QN387_26250, partial [Pseudomonas sp. CCI3.1]